MERLNLSLEQEAKMREVFEHMCEGGRVKAVDTADGQLKTSEIIAVYRDNTVILGEFIETDVCIDDIVLLHE